METRREQIKETVEKLKLEVGMVESYLDQVLDELSASEIRIAEHEDAMVDSQKKFEEAQNLINSLLEEHVEAQQSQGTIITQRVLNYTELSYSQLQRATQDFDDSLKIGEGGYGSVFRGFLRCTVVAVKKLNPQSMQGQSEFDQEVNALSKVRHPNLVTLIEACSSPEACLVYEFLPNGSLEDRLNCKDNTSALSWQVRIRIAAEICSALVFLHSSELQSVVHGDLKPANILLDANFMSKVGDFGICRLLNQSDSTNVYHTDPKGTFAYIDPEFGSTGELTSSADVYSFGVIILRLLTGKPALGVIKEVQEALASENLQDILDKLAGDWPYVQAQQLAHLGLKCCEMNRRDRPNLEIEVWRVLEPMVKASSLESLSSSSMDLKDDRHAPSHFMCPILQEVMRDPQVATDGYTYEAEAIRGWFDNGNNTSPMTNMELPNLELLPNHALRSAIKEWLQKQGRQRH